MYIYIYYIYIYYVYIYYVYIYIYILCIYILCIYIYILCIYILCVYIYILCVYIYYVYIYIYILCRETSHPTYSSCAKKQQPYLSPSCAQPTDAVDEMQVWAAWHGSNFLMFSKWRMYPTRWVYCVSVVLTVASFWCALFI